MELYEQECPSEWQRSIESMRREWQVHNLFYSFSFKTKNTGDVDLNNEDEDIYNRVLVKYFFG